MALGYPHTNPSSTSAWSVSVESLLTLLGHQRMSPSSTSAESSSVEQLPRQREHRRRSANRCTDATWTSSTSQFEQQSVVAIVGPGVDCCVSESRIAVGDSIHLGGLGGNPLRQLCDEDRMLSKFVLRKRM